MKQRIFIAIACVVVAAVILLSLPPAHPVTQPTIPLPSLNKPTQPTVPTTLPDPGVVRLYSCDIAWVMALRELAAQYTELTGTEVTVLSPATGEDCQTALAAYMDSDEPPTAFCFHTQSQMEAWQNYLLPLEDTPLADTLYSADFGLTVGDHTLALPMDMEAFGLLFNANLLGSKGSYTRDDITDLAGLTTAVQILKNNSTKAFPVGTMSDDDALRLLSGGDSGDILAFLNLYINNCNSSGEEWDRFLNGKSVFCLGTTADYDLVAQQTNKVLKVRNLDILPTFSAGAMQYFCTTAWGINGCLRQEDVDVTVEFLSWLFTASEESDAPVDQLQSLTPFADADWYGNPLEKKLLGYMKTEPAVIGWKVDVQPEDPILVALNAYLTTPGDETWSALLALLETT